MKCRIALGIALAALLIVGGCAQPDTGLYQVATLQSLIAGQYDGEITAKTLRQYGDTGLGTFDDLDGEMIIVDGVIYKARVDGSVTVVADDETIPFANVASLGDEKVWSLAFDGGYDELKSQLDRLVPDNNMPVVFRIDGTFHQITYRSVPEQTAPYPPLTDVVQQQTVFEQEMISGNLVGFRFPAYFGDLNAVGYHLHFISADKQHAGHVLEVVSGEVDIRSRTLDQLHVIFPENMADVVIETDADAVHQVESEE